MRNRLSKLVALGAALLWTGAAVAQEVVPAQAPYAPPPPVLEIYYSPVCAPCRLDLPIVAEFAKEDGSRVRIVILDQVPRAKADLRAAEEGFRAVR